MIVHKACLRLFYWESGGVFLFCFFVSEKERILGPGLFERDFGILGRFHLHLQWWGGFALLCTLQVKSQICN
jgi:hypothetical protein